MDLNSIEDSEEVPELRPYMYTGLDGNGAIWVKEPTEQPGFLFPVARTTAQTTRRRQITEEASLAVSPPQVRNKHSYILRKAS